jgi:hypothetical protein
LYEYSVVRFSFLAGLTVFGLSWNGTPRAKLPG